MSELLKKDSDGDTGTTSTNNTAEDWKLKLYIRHCLQSRIQDYDTVCYCVVLCGLVGDAKGNFKIEAV